MFQFSKPAATTPGNGPDVAAVSSMLGVAAVCSAATAGPDYSNGLIRILVSAHPGRSQVSDDAQPAALARAWKRRMSVPVSGCHCTATTNLSGSGSTPISIASVIPSEAVAVIANPGASATD